jgi:hypothetical protein
VFAHSGRKFCGNFGFLPGSGRAIILASFQDAGKWQSRRQWLNKCVMWTRDLLGRCLRHSLGMPSIPQALPAFRDDFLDIPVALINPQSYKRHCCLEGVFTDPYRSNEPGEGCITSLRKREGDMIFPYSWCRMTSLWHVV